MIGTPASLRGRLLIPLLLAMLLVWVLTGVVSYVKARHEAGELLDGQLAQSSKLLMAQAEHERLDAGHGLAGIEEVVDNPDHPYEQPLEFQIWTADGRLLLKSDEAPSVPLSRESGYSDLQHAGKPWRMFSMWSRDRKIQIQVAEPVANREQVALEVATQVGLPILLALPLVALVIIGTVRHALRPMDALASTLATRGADNLTPLPTNGDLPQEIKPLVTNLDNLLARLNHVLNGERRFTADAAHELRTPLAAIQIQAQVALASHQAEGRAHALEQVLAGTRRAARLVEQLLRLARLDPLAGLPATQSVDLATLARQVVEDLHLPGERVCLDLAENVTVAADPDLLRVALRNLLDNAARYSPADTPIDLGVSGEGGTRIWVADRGPGVPQEELPRLTERFYRSGESIREGSGLGLAIVERIAQLHGARLQLENRAEGGLRAVLGWG